MRSGGETGATFWKLILSIALVWGIGASGAAAQLKPEQIQIIKDAAAAICNTVRDARGKKSDVQIQGDIKAQLGGLVGKLADAGITGSGSLRTEEFEGISREATASALGDDRLCRERVFNRMFDKLSSTPNDTITTTYLASDGEHAA